MHASFQATRRGRHFKPLNKRAGHTVVAVVGLGYVGLPTAIALRGAGCRIVGIDVGGPPIERDSQRARPSGWSPNTVTWAGIWRAMGSCSPIRSRRSTQPTSC